jgi:hypothetical protein
MGEIHVHEFMSFDGVIDAPTWTFEYGFDPKMGELLGAVTGRSRGILLGRTTYEAFAQAWPDRTVEDDPGCAVLRLPTDPRRGDAALHRPRTRRASSRSRPASRTRTA